jgi:hypothetical protein
MTTLKSLRWGPILGASAAVFLIVMVLITGVELFRDAPLNKVVQGQSDTGGTTVSDVATGHRPKASTSPTPEATDTATDDPDASGSADPEVPPSDGANPDTSGSAAPQESLSPGPVDSADPGDATPEAPVSPDNESAPASPEQLVPELETVAPSPSISASPLG